MSTSPLVYVGASTMVIGVLGVVMGVVVGSLGSNFVTGSFGALIVGCVIALLGLRG